MKSTSADEVIIHALWPGPGTPGSVLVPSVLLMYASRLATRSSRLGAWPAADSPAGVGDTTAEAAGEAEGAGDAGGWLIAAAGEATALADGAADSDGVAVGEAFVTSAGDIVALPNATRTEIPTTASIRNLVRRFGIGVHGDLILRFWSRPVEKRFSISSVASRTAGAKLPRDLIRSQASLMPRCTFNT